MLRVGDTVKLIEDFNNEPGVIRAGTTGELIAISEKAPIQDLYFVRFNDVSELKEHSRVNNHIAGLPMYREEIERV